MAEPEPPERPQLRAVPAPAEEIPDSGKPPVYADVTAPGERRPVLPPWLQAGNRRHTLARWRGRAWHELKFHGLRAPVYLGLTVFWGVVGAGWLAWEWLHWWLFPVPFDVHADAVRDGWRAWRAVSTDHRRIAKARAWISLAVCFAAAFAVRLLLLWAHGRQVLAGLGVAAMLAGARYGRPEGARIVQAAHVPAEFEPVTQDLITEALASVGISGIDRYLREGKHLRYPHPVRQDGPGWRAEVELPRGVTATMVIERRDRLASGLRRPLGAVWPEPMLDDHPGLLEMWIGQQDITKARPAPWPLAKTGKADIFGLVPFGTDPRRRPVGAPLFEVNWLIGAAPGQGKTSAVRVLGCAAALDPVCDLWVHEHAGKGDLEPLAKVCHRYVSGLDDEAIEYAAESFSMLRVELERRSQRFKKLPREAKPEGKLTRELAQRDRRLRPLVAIFDECQNVFMHPKYGKQAAEDAAYVIRLGRAYGIIVVLATQRPDKESLPTAIRGIVTARFCLQVPDQDANDMIMGTGAYKAGYNAVTFRPKTDAGLGWLKGGESPGVVRTYYLDLPATERVATRARALREQAGALSGYALGEDGGSVAQDVLGDVLTAFGQDPALHWDALAGRLAARWPDRWADVTGDAVSAQMRALQVPSVTVSMAGQKARGCRKEAVEAAAR
jgi:DNA segregation ATPase FtsK/SpoIIIE, S-DNA-T family